MIQIFISQLQGEIDYSKYVTPGSIQITKGLNVPTTCALTMVNFDEKFVMPLPRSYIRIYSTKTKKSLFTGYMTNSANSSFVGLGKTVPHTNYQMFSFALAFTSDEYLLNIKSVDFIPAFVNQTQGQILRNLAEVLCPNFFNYTYISDGDLVPYLAYDPTKSWSELAKQFGDASRFRYSVIDKQIHFMPYGDGPLGVVYDETMHESTFDPSQLKTQALTTPIVNDVTIIGAQEAGNQHEDHFIGDGFNGEFALKHKVYGLDTSFSGSSVLLSDDWTAGNINTQNWYAEDAASQFDYSAGALNIVSGFPMEFGQSYIMANNGIEFAGGVVLQHGEVTFNAASMGLIGGLYDDATMDPATCESAFLICDSPTQAVVVTASGASGVTIQPFRLGGTLSGEGFMVTTQVNKTYTLSTKVSIPLPTRYTQVYRTIAGVAYGGLTQAPTPARPRGLKSVSLPIAPIPGHENAVLTQAVPPSPTSYALGATCPGTITWSVTETDAYSGEIHTWTHTVSTDIPQTAIYALVNNVELNITLNSTEVWTPPPSSLKINCEIGVGLLAPIYISGNVQYTGAFVSPSGGNLPILPDGFGPQQQFDMGSGIGSQSAEIDSGTQFDTLNFYGNDLPGVGTRIDLQSWESQVSVSRVQDSDSIALESAVVGDDGIRSTTVSNLVPLPRTSEDCDNAAAAFLADRVDTFYQGSYNANYTFFNNPISDIEYWPTCGRFLPINSPVQNINKKNFLVSAVTTVVTEMFGEIINHQIQFGPDLYLDKLLATIMPTNTNVLTPMDAVVQPTPQQLAQIGAHYLPDVSVTALTGIIKGPEATIKFADGVKAPYTYEVRKADLNWGQQDNYLITTVYGDGEIVFPRLQIDQTWYIRQVANINGTLSTSRRTKVIRVVAPLIPSAPTLLTSDTSFVQMDFQGDIRNVEGVEVRADDDETVLYQSIVGTRFDLGINWDAIRNQLYPGETGLNGLGQYQIAIPDPSERIFYAHFFNLLWNYGPGLALNLVAPSAPSIQTGYRWGAALQIIVNTAPIDLARTDISTTLVQLATGGHNFDGGDLFQELSVASQPGTVTTNVPTNVGSIAVRAVLFDHISSGAWSNTIIVPSGDLIASDYLASQGSVPPAISNNLTGSGGIFTYSTTANSITLASMPFSLGYPNGAVDQVPASINTYTQCVDTMSGLILSGYYGFFPTVKNPTTNTPTLLPNGPYQNYTNSQATQALIAQFADGGTPLTNGAFVIQTAASITGTTGGGGGGTSGGGNCGVEDAMLLTSEGQVALRDVCVGDAVITPTGMAVIKRKEVIHDQYTFSFKTESGLESEAGEDHSLRFKLEWTSLRELADYDYCVLWTVNELQDKVVEMKPTGKKNIVKIELGPMPNEDMCEHIYQLDGFWCHNIVKSGSYYNY